MDNLDFIERISCMEDMPQHFAALVGRTGGAEKLYRTVSDRGRRALGREQPRQALEVGLGCRFLNRSTAE
jgi:hypothetical protein